jgi:hypothetical protein
MLFINLGSMAVYLLMGLGVVLQIKKTLKLKTTRDIAVWEIMLRLSASLVLMIKFVLIKDWTLITGQGIFIAAMLTYAAIIFWLKIHERQKEAK